MMVLTRISPGSIHPKLEFNGWKNIYMVYVKRFGVKRWWLNDISGQPGPNCWPVPAWLEVL